jgi:hypothetical protein
MSQKVVKMLKLRKNLNLKWLPIFAYLPRSVGNHLPDYTVSSQTLVNTGIMKESALKMKTIYSYSCEKVGSSLQGEKFQKLVVVYQRYGGVFPDGDSMFLQNVGNHLHCVTFHKTYNSSAVCRVSCLTILSKRTIAA